MTLQQFKQDYGKGYTKVSKSNERFYKVLGIGFAAMFLFVMMLMVSRSAGEGYSPAFLVIPVTCGIGLAAFMIWCMRRNVRNEHTEFGNAENIKVYKAACIGKRIEQEQDMAGYVQEVCYIDFSLGEGFMDGAAKTPAQYYEDIDIQGECVVVQLGNSIASSYSAFPIGLYDLDSYDEPGDSDYLKRMAATNISVSADEIPKLSTGLYTFGIVMCLYMAIGGIMTIPMVIETNGSSMTVGTAAIFILVTAVIIGGLIYAAITINKYKTRKIQGWFRYLEEVGISQAAMQDTRTAYEIYTKYPKKAVYEYVYSLNPAIAQMIGK